MGPKHAKQCCELVVNYGVVYGRTNIESDDEAKEISALQHKSKKY